MTVQIGHLYKKRTIRNLDGSIRLLQDDTMGGTIIRDGQVVNQEAVDILAEKQKDRETAATEATQIGVPQAIIEERTVAPSKMQELEKKVAEQDTKLDAILALLKNGK
jgi:uncharacterized coiled-coil protein SlyX